MDDYKLSPRTSKILAAVAAVLAAIIALINVIAEPTEPAPVPTPTPSITAPAPLPPATGIDGPGIAEGIAPDEAQADGLPTDPEQLPPDVQAEPDAGKPAAVVPGDGTGGEVFVSSPAWEGKQRLNAGFRYPSGTLHGAWDIGIWRGTKLYAAKAGVIVGTNDGVKNHPAGAQYAIAGSPSNWLLLCANVGGKPAVLYYQHLSPGLKVRRGQKVTAGQYLAKSGNTGNSTGDHLHISASFVPWSCSKFTQARAEAVRYRYLTVPNERLFAPSKFWTTPKAKPAVSVAAASKACRTNNSAANFRYARKGLGLGTKTNGCGPAARKQIRKVQRELGYRGRAADGIPGRQSLEVICKRGRCRVIA